VLATTNPTAVPLSAIVSFQASSATIPLPATPTAGTHPSGIPNAPPLPDISKINPANYPALDVVPPTDSAQVKQWIAQVAATGIVIPNIAPTVPGGCPANPAALADPSRCWWTCTGCTRAADITTCPATLNWGLTYDDGPAYYTPNLLTYLDSQSLKSTFFVVGSRVISFPHTLQYEYVNSHHIAVHTWSHPYLTQLTNEQIIAELGWSKKVIKDVLGVTPNMMRPPFGDIDDRVRAISLAMGLTPVMWTRISARATFDTDDFDIHSGATSVYQVLQNWEYILGNVTQIQTGFIVLEHDLFEESVEVATGYILPDALAHNPPFTIKPVVGCQALTLADAYIETNDNSTHPPALAAALSVGAVTTTSVAPTSTSGGSLSGATGISVPGFALALSVFAGIFASVHML
jgi:peptidoglycan/xylan/chitin deacetylase (PgdA/CDA1 family)